MENRNLQIDRREFFYQSKNNQSNKHPCIKWIIQTEGIFFDVLVGGIFDV